MILSFGFATMSPNPKNRLVGNLVFFFPVETTFCAEDMLAFAVQTSPPSKVVYVHMAC